MIFGRTDLRIGVSGAKFDAESDFEVRLAVAPQKPDQNCEKLIFRSQKFPDFFFRRKFWTEKQVFRNFCLVFEELRPNGPQNQIRR